MSGKFRYQNLDLRLSIVFDVWVDLTETDPFYICPNGCAEQLLSTVYGTWDVVYNFD